MFELSRAGKPLEESPLVSSVLPMKPSDGTRCGVVIKENALQMHLNLRGDPDDCAFVQVVEECIGIAVPTKPNTVVRKQGLIAAWLGPDEWLLISALDGSVSMKSQLQSALGSLHCALNDLSGGQTIITVSGARSLDVLSKGCTLDLHPRVFGPGQCAQSQLAKSSALIIPRATNLSAYDVVVRRSFADYLWQWLIKAGNEYGVSNVA